MTAITAPGKQIPRDRYGRPLVIPEAGGKPIPYSRCTSYIDVLDSTYNLSRWQQRMVALGLGQRPDLMLAVIATDTDDKDALNKLCEQALEAAKAHAAATTGTALHALTERIDRGQDVGVVPTAYLADLAAYTEATQDLTAVFIEQFCVLDPLKIGGTPDRVVKYEGKRYIADVKTGNIEWGALKIAMQLAVYARSKTYDIATGQRGMHDAEVDKGLIIHMPAGTGTCELVWVDLLAGWDAVAVAKNVREKRKLTFKALTTPFDAPAPPPVAPEPEEPLDLLGLIASCPVEGALRRLWALHEDVWTDEHTQAAQARIEELGRSNPSAQPKEGAAA